MICEYCGKEITKGAIRKNRKYCDSYCKHRAWEKANIEKIKDTNRQHMSRQAGRRTRDVDYENMTASQLMEVFYCDRLYVKQCVAEGMPHKNIKFIGVRFDLEKCQAWHRGEEVI
jgi:hypothetical protein